MVARLALLAVAVLALGWLGVLWRDNRIIDDVSPGLVPNAQLRPSQFERDARRLEDAGLLNPDPTWKLHLGLALVGHSPRRAVRQLEPLVASEPENVTAWRLLYGAAWKVDRPLAVRAQARIKQLDPLAAR